MLTEILRCSKSNRHLLEESGFSLVEVLVGSAILVGIGASVFYTTSVKSINAAQATNRFRCEASTASAISFLQSQGIVSQIVNVVPVSGSRTVPTALQFTSSYVDLGDLWNGNPEIMGDATGAPIVLNSGALIGGSVRNLAAIYNNSGTDFCSAGGNYGPLSSYLSSINGGLPPGSTTTIQVQPYSLLNGSINCSLPKPLILYPRPSSSTGNAYANNWVQPGGTSTSDYGLVATIRTTFNEGGRSFTCSSQHKFQYQRDIVPPVTISTATNTTPNTTQFPATPNCTSTTSVPLDISIGYNSSPIPPEPGTVLLCKDQSTRLVYDNYSNCYPGPAPGPQPRPALTGGASVVTPAPQYPSYGNWVPCDQAQVCGVSASSAAADTSSNVGLNLHFAALPYDCQVALQAVAIDTSGNFSTATALNITDPTLTPQPLLQRPTCGPTFCYAGGALPGNTWNPALMSAQDYNNGYYMCGAACP